MVHDDDDDIHSEWEKRRRHEARSKSFAIQYDVRMARTKRLHYFSKYR